MVWAAIAAAAGVLLTLAAAASLPPPPASTGPGPGEEPTRPVASKAGVEAELARCTRLAEEDPDDPGAWSGLGDALMQRFRERPDAALLARAQTAYERALRLDKRWAAALVGMAWVANTRHDFEAGNRWARQALSLEPGMPDAHALLGDAAVERGAYDEAFKQYQAALDARPDLSSCARSAHLLWLTGDPRRAKALMYRAIQAGGPHAENSAWCRAELGLMLFKTGALVLAEKQIRQALAEAPANPHILAAMAQIQAARTNYPASILLYEQALDIAPTHAVLAALTDLYGLVGERDKAAAMFQRVLDFHHAHAHEHAHPHGDDAGTSGSHAHPHDHPHGNAELATFLADHDRDLSAALREAEAAYAGSKSVPVTDTLAWCYHKNQRHAEARETILQALRWKTPEATILFHAGMIHAAAGDKPAAQKYLYQALSLNPNFHPVQAGVAAESLRGLRATPASAPGSVPVTAAAPPASPADLPQP